MKHYLCPRKKFSVLIIYDEKERKEVTHTFRILSILKSKVLYEKSTINKKCLVKIS